MLQDTQQHSESTACRMQRSQHPETPCSILLHTTPTAAHKPFTAADQEKAALMDITGSLDAIRLPQQVTMHTQGAVYSMGCSTAVVLGAVPGAVRGTV